MTAADGQSFHDHHFARLLDARRHLLDELADWSSDPDFVHAPFSSGCGRLMRDLEVQQRERAVLVCTGIAMPKYVPPEIFRLTVTPGHFERMVDVPDGAFLDGERGTR